MCSVAREGCAHPVAPGAPAQRAARIGSGRRPCRCRGVDAGGELPPAPVPFAKISVDTFFLNLGNLGCMADNDEETALQATAELHHVVSELRALLTAAVAAQLQVDRASWSAEDST